MIPALSSKADPPLLLRVDGPPGSGKTRFLARQAIRLSLEAAGATPVTAGERPMILMLAQTPLNAQRLRHALREEKTGGGFLPGSPIRVVTLDDWLFRLLEEATDSSGTNPVKTEPSRNNSPEHPPDLLDSHEASILLHEILSEEIPPEHPLSHAARHPSMARALWDRLRERQSRGLQPEENTAESDLTASLSAELLARIDRRFLEKTAFNGLYSRSDLANRVLERLQRNPDWGESLRRRYTAILADEAQELNAPQHALLAFLRLPLALAGHAGLSVRRFRGAEPSSFTDLSPYPGFAVQSISLTECRRGDGSLLRQAARIAPLSVFGRENPPDDAPLRLILENDPVDEALAVADAIRAFVGQSRKTPQAARWDDCAILLRSARFRSELISALRRRKIPFHEAGFPDALSGLHHGLFDFFRILAGWETLPLAAETAENPAQLREALQKQLAAPAEDNRSPIRPYAWDASLERWLEASLRLGKERATDTSPNEASLSGPKHSDSAPDAENADPAPGLSWLGGAYARYRASGEWLPLWDELMTTLPASRDGESDAATQTALSNLHTRLVRLDAFYKRAFHRPFPLRALLAHAHSLWEEASLADDEPFAEEPRPGVRLLSLHQAQGEEFPFVAIPFLTADEFPLRRCRLELQPGRSRLEDEAEQEAEEARLLALGMTRAAQRLIVSAHRHEDGAPVALSPWFETLRRPEEAASPSKLGADEPEPLCGDEFAEAMPSGDSEASDYTGDRTGSSWAKLPRQAAVAPVLEASEILPLSASAMKTYMGCPRRYYYRCLLFLPQESGTSAIAGLLTHRVFELFNQSAQTGNYTVERLKLLIESLFRREENPDAFADAGYSEREAHQLAELGNLGVAALRDRLLASADDLERKGYFRQYATLRRAQAEKKLDNVAIEGLGDRCRLKGSIDALIETEDGGWDVLDYKTSDRAYGITVTNCEKRFRDGLQAAVPDDDALTPPERFDVKLSRDYPADYQLPLYFLALRQDPDYRDALRHIVMQMVRPAFPGNPEQGSIRLAMDADAMADMETRWISEIRRFIVEPILEERLFEPAPAPAACRHCAYASICEAGDSADDDEETAE